MSPEKALGWGGPRQTPILWGAILWGARRAQGRGQSRGPGVGNPCWVCCAKLEWTQTGTYTSPPRGFPAPGAVFLTAAPRKGAPEHLNA